MNCWIVVFPALVSQASNSWSCTVVSCLLLKLATQDISNTSATAPALLSYQSVSIDHVHTLNKHAHKHVIGRTGIVLNAETEPHGSEGSGRGSKRGLLSRRNRHSDSGEIALWPLSPWFWVPRAEQSSEGGEGSGDGDHSFR